ncbi:MAG: MFS transporter [Clostridia bacterium]|nr:MFS transporter [Clostridia bacterium]
MYSMGYLGIAILVQSTVKWYQFYYAPPELALDGLRILVPIGIVGLAMVAARIIDGVADPLVAYLSDQSKNKKGRRIPFILYGSVPLTVTYILIWFPPVAGESIINFIYLTVMLSLFFIFFTIVVAPYLALIVELTKTNKERINLTMLMAVTQILGVIIAEAGAAILINLYNFKVMGIVLGLLALASIILTPIFVREDLAEQTAISSINMFNSMKMTFTNKDFVYYLSAYMAVWFGINTLTISMPYIFEVLLDTPAETSGYVIAGAFLMALLFSPLVPRLTLKYSKKRVLFMAALFFAMIMASTAFFGTLLSYPLVVVIVVLSGLPLAVGFVVTNAMVADIAEQDSLKHGLRQEGMYFGAQGLVIKLVIALSSFITPMVFHTFGYTAENPLGLQLVGPMAAVIILISLMFLTKYSMAE